ncbi:hypothetical protein P9112_011037 [Eukaryota sp. TZLM1-RC]
MSGTNQPRPSIRVGSSTAQRRIHEEDTGPSSSPLTTDLAPVPSSSVEASALPEATLPEGSTPKEDDSLPEDAAPMEGSSPPRDSVPVEGNNPSKDSIPSEGRSPSLVSYDDEDAEDSEAPPSSSSLRVSEVPSSPHPERNSEVPPSPSIQRKETVHPSQNTTEGSEMTPFLALRTFLQYLSEEQRKWYEQIFPDLVEYEEPPKEFSPLPHHQVPPTAPPSEIDRIPGEVSKEYLERFLQEERNCEHRKRLDRQIEARRGTSSTPAQPTPSQASSYASSSVHRGASRQHNPYGR